MSEPALKELVIRQLVCTHGWSPVEAFEATENWHGCVDGPPTVSREAVAGDLAESIAVLAERWQVGPTISSGIQIVHPLAPAGPLVVETATTSGRPTAAELRVAEDVVHACNTLPRLLAALDCLRPDNWLALAEMADHGDDAEHTIALTCRASELRRLRGALAKARRE